MKTGFDNEKYLKIQSEHIKKRIAQFGDKLYLEFGGKLFDDNHASRVLPGFKPDSKLDMLKQLKDEAEIIIVISAKDIEKNKVRGDLGITYDEDVLRLRGEFEKVGFYVSSVVMTHYNGQSSADTYRQRLIEEFGSLIMFCLHDAFIDFILMNASLEKVYRKTRKLLHEFRSKDLFDIKQIVFSIV